MLEIHNSLKPSMHCLGMGICFQFLISLKGLQGNNKRQPPDFLLGRQPRDSTLDRKRKQKVYVELRQHAKLSHGSWDHLVARDSFIILIGWILHCPCYCHSSEVLHFGGGAISKFMV